MNETDSSQVRSLKSLKDEIRSDIFVGNEAENLISQHNNQFLEGLSEIQKWSDFYKERQCNVIPFCKTFFKNAMTIIPAPRGIIKRIYTIADGDWRRPVYYDQCKWPEPENYAAKFKFLIAPLTGNPKLPLGFQYADASTDLKLGDTTHPFHRAKGGIWAMLERNIHISPWIQSNEVLVIEWAGIKTATEWTDDDLVSSALDFKKTLKLYLQYAHERDYGTDVQNREMLRNDFDEALADLMWQCDQEAKVIRETENHPQQHIRWLDLLLSLKPIVPAVNQSNAGVLHGTGSPIATGQPTSPPAAYIDDSTGNFWVVSNGVWIELIGS